MGRLERSRKERQQPAARYRKRDHISDNDNSERASEVMDRGRDSTRSGAERRVQAILLIDIHAVWFIRNRLYETKFETSRSLEILRNEAS